MFCFIVTGNPILHTTVVMEILGRWKDTSIDDGSGHWDMFGNRKEAKEEIIIRLFMGEFAIS